MWCVKVVFFLCVCRQLQWDTYHSNWGTSSSVRSYHHTTWFLSMMTLYLIFFFFFSICSVLSDSLLSWTHWLVLLLSLQKLSLLRCSSLVLVHVCSHMTVTWLSCDHHVICCFFFRAPYVWSSVIHILQLLLCKYVFLEEMIGSWNENVTIIKIRFR